jgi:hypothetical protein
LKNKADKILVLLIGTNPLPNYIVGSYLRKNYNKFVLIYSAENKDINQYSTADYAKKLKKHLKLNNNNCTLLPLSDISNPSIIRNDLKERFSKENENIDEVHLNYTGGTKTMVVHVYNFLKEKFDDKFNASYLDARTNYIVYDDKDSRKEIRSSIDISTLVDIHLYEKARDKLFYTFDNYKYCCNKSSDDKNFDKIFDKIFDVIKKGIKNNKQEDILNKFKKQSGDKQNYINGLYENFFKEFSNNLDEKDVKSVLNEVEKRKQPFFSGGFWLEWYVYLCLREKIKKELTEGEHFGINLKVKKSGGSNDFELDIFIIYNSRLTGISITKGDNQGDCKLKGFEVIHRVKQIGGDESKAILITGLKKYKDESNKGTKKLQKDLSYVTGTAEDKIIVFGIDDWADIGSKVCKEVFK